LAESSAPGPTPLQSLMERQGNWLFRWRSYLPLPLLGFLLVWAWGAPLDTWPGVPEPLWESGCLAIGLAGLAIRMWVGGQVPYGTSGRNVGAQVAYTVNTTGPYSLVRHPLYVGNLLMWLAPAAFTGGLLVVLATLIYFGVAYERIMMAEERHLQKEFGHDYLDWARRTPTFIPSLRHWTPGRLPFSWRTAFRKEYSGLLGLVVTLCVLELIASQSATGHATLDPVLRGALIGSVIAYVALRTLKRRTRWLYVEGR
jgi:protein-S-isoprenylcysteine O-methyltransferase Ste14